MGNEDKPLARSGIIYQSYLNYTRTMLEKAVGAMLVLANEKLVGLITERDFLKLVA